MTDYWLLLPAIAFCLIALVFVLLWRREHDERVYFGYTLAGATAENTALQGDLLDARSQREKLNRENADLRQRFHIQEGLYKNASDENKELTVKIGTLTTLVKDLSAENEALHKAAEQVYIPARPAPKRASLKKVSE
jgi:hypothetical protein